MLCFVCANAFDVSENQTEEMISWFHLRERLCRVHTKTGKENFMTFSLTFPRLLIQFHDLKIDKGTGDYND